METRSVTVRERIQEAGSDARSETGDGFGVQRHSCEAVMRFRSIRQVNSCVLTVGPNAVRSEDAVLADQPRLVKATQPHVRTTRQAAQNRQRT